ncbi:hypothetical protein K431DRAFT_307757 [Polychaeton citri CBS 116435]|uniref:Uncharacterized protein n=1 Tax=Polychaeton citri CBS 116435 TaxID=1314669 RepID=A0A9P4UJJ9_9PEZI|nr:hypothetical protein K431DRAFT_307757 [Polychaeton citri CBS 116435]
MPSYFERNMALLGASRPFVSTNLSELPSETAETWVDIWVNKTALSVDGGNTGLQPRGWSRCWRETEIMVMICLPDTHPKHRQRVSKVVRECQRGAIRGGIALATCNTATRELLARLVEFLVMWLWLVDAFYEEGIAEASSNYTVSKQEL